MGTDSFSFRVSDGQAFSANISTITINVTNTAPQTNWSEKPVAIDEYWVFPNDILNVGYGEITAKVVKGPQSGRVIRLNDTVYNGQTLSDYLGLGSPQLRTELQRRLTKIGGRSSLLENDFDADSDPLKVKLVRNVDYGSLELADDGTFIYEPDPLHAVDQSFTYRIYDGIQWSQPTTVMIHVQNDPPVSRNISITTGRLGSFGQKADDKALAIPGNSTDKEGNKLTFSLVTSPTKGTAIVNTEGSYSYKNTNGLVGTDSFTYRSYDGVNYSAPATISVTIKNDGPTAKGDIYDAVRDFREGGLFDLMLCTVLSAACQQMIPIKTHSVSISKVVLLTGLLR